MSEKLVREIDIKDIGYSGVIKYLLVDYLKEKTGLQVIVEPQPVNLSEPHVRIMYTGIDIDSGPDISGYFVEKLHTLKISLLLTLTAYGDGPDKFLDSVINSSFALKKVFDSAFSIRTVGSYGITVEGKKRPGGQFFRNEEEGKKQYLYEENYDVNIYIPYVEVLNG